MLTQFIRFCAKVILGWLLIGAAIVWATALSIVAGWRRLKSWVRARLTTETEPSDSDAAPSAE